MAAKFSKRIENTVGKGEIARYEQFLLFPQYFQKVCFTGASKGVIVWEWVNTCLKFEVLHNFWGEIDNMKSFLYIFNAFSSCFFNPLPNDKILDVTKLKAFADDKLIVAKILISHFDKVGNAVGKGENVGYQHEFQYLGHIVFCGLQIDG